ncbi:MAG: alpha-L-glutamate ligase-like protein [Opitutales bacterium]|nr:alpha-L-glutamate ligase-like protein [Opitutales bacterium]
MKLPEWIHPRILRERGVLGINARNHRFIQEHNPRRLYPRVDDKLFTKRLAMEAGIAIPPLYGTVEFHHQIRGFHDRMAAHDSFVIKPARGAGGNGVMVLVGRNGGDYLKTNGKPVPRAQIERHLANILSGLHSLGGHLDRAIIEHRVRSAPPLDTVSFQGVPDVRVLVFKGYPVMAMLRLSTSLSDGRANLHQGAIGVGLDIATGRAIHATCRNRIVTEHPDTGMAFTDIALPDWPTLLLLAARCYELTGLGYLGVDLVIDAEKGPLVLELNARPGLSIQIACGQGLLPRLQTVEREATGIFPKPAEARVAFAADAFAADGR